MLAARVAVSAGQGACVSRLLEQGGGQRIKICERVPFLPGIQENIRRPAPNLRSGLESGAKGRF